MNNGRNILLVDDDRLIRRSLYEMLMISGYQVTMANDGIDALEKLNKGRMNLVIADVRMPHMDGMQLLGEIKERYPDLPVIMMTGYASVENAVDAIRQGAFDYITKPIVDSEMTELIERALASSVPTSSVIAQAQVVSSDEDGFCGLIGRNEKMRKIYEMVRSVAHTKATVLIHGESGTGKRLIAQAIHSHDPLRGAQPFVEVSCGALPKEILESELFGHVRGSFTTAVANREGRFEMADNGTIFLDEIDAFVPHLQVKLLRVLQEKEFERVGDNKTLKVDVRVIAATNQDLAKLIKRGQFREDLYYRLNVISIDLPALRERIDDIPLLAQHFLGSFRDEVNKELNGFSKEALDVMMSYQWPGNVRELENVVERAAILCKEDVITIDDLPDNVVAASKKRDSGTYITPGWRSLKDALREPERQIIIETLERVGWNKKEAAKVLGINRTTLYNKMKELGLISKRSPHDFEIEEEEVLGYV